MIKQSIFIYVLLIGLIAFTGCKKNNGSDNEPHPADKLHIKLLPPAGNKIYHSAFPDFGGTEDRVTAAAIQNFESLAGKPITWAYFSNNWLPETGGIVFPREDVQTIHNAGKIPFIRLMPRANFDEGGPDPVYTMRKFIDGDFDNQLKKWARDAKSMGFPLLAEFGTEVNGNWFPWNAQYNGKNSKIGYGSPDLYDGMERFRDAYRHIIDICREEGAENITWFFHCDVNSDPDVDWNNRKGYYPGDDYIDWIGISAYGDQMSGEEWRNFKDILADEWGNIQSISPSGKPIAILEWGTVDNTQHQKPQWIADALQSVIPGGQFYPHIKAMSYWHENWEGVHLRIDTSPDAVAAYQQGVADDIFVSEGVFSNEGN